MLSFYRILNFIMILLIAACLKGESDSVEVEPEKREKVYLDVIKIRGGPSLETYWVEMPEITFCNSSGVSGHRARNAVNYWKRLGYDIQKVNTVVEDVDCLREPKKGEVIVKLISNDIDIGDNLAVTRVSYRKDNKQILYATIYLIGGFANDARLLEHEIGHALGWKHFNRSYHIMNSSYPNTGHDSFGLNYISYQRRIINIKEDIEDSFNDH